MDGGEENDTRNVTRGIGIPECTVAGAKRPPAHLIAPLTPQLRTSKGIAKLKLVFLLP